MQRLHPEQQNSSLGISKALREEVRLFGENGGNGNQTRGESSSNSNAVKKRSTLTDAHFNKVPSSEANIFTWTRFIISLYYNKMAVNMFGFWTGWKWYNRVDDIIILGALPTPSQIKKLHKEENVDIVINMCNEFPGYEKLYQELNITQLRLETPDFCIPSLDTIHKGISEIIQLKQKSPKSCIYLHCKAGRGRSAVMTMAYLLRTYKLDLPQAQKLLIEKRYQVDKDICQTDEIRLFYKDLIADIEAGKFTRVD